MCILFPIRRRRRHPPLLRKCQFAQVSTVASLHLPSRLLQQRLVLIKTLSQQRSQDFFIKRICAFVLLYHPRRNPLAEHRVRQHLHQSKCPTLVTTAPIPHPLELPVQISHPKETVIAGSHRTGKRLHKFCTTKTNCSNCFEAIIILLVAYHSMPLRRGHMPPMCNHHCPSITLVARMLSISTIRAEARRYHQTHGSAALLHTTLDDIVLPPELVQRNIANLFLRHRLLPISNLLANKLQTFIELIDTAIVMCRRIVRLIL